MSGLPYSSNSGPSRPRASMAASTSTPISAANPSRCRSPTRRSGSAGIHGPPRAARLPVGAAPASPLPPQEMRAHLDTLKQLTEAEGRDFSALTTSYKAPLYDTGILSPDGSRRTLLGEPEDVASDIRTFAAIGVHELIFDCRGQSIAPSIERLQWFATDVLPLVDGYPQADRAARADLQMAGSRAAAALRSAA